MAGAGREAPGAEGGGDSGGPLGGGLPPGMGPPPGTKPGIGKYCPDITLLGGPGEAIMSGKELDYNATNEQSCTTARLLKQIGLNR